MDADQKPSTENKFWFQDFRNKDGSVFVDAVSCDNKTCENESRYYIRTVCCHRPMLGCRGCIGSFLAAQEKREQAGYTSTCEEDGCGKKYVPTKMWEKVKKLHLTS